MTAGGGESNLIVPSGTGNGNSTQHRNSGNTLGYAIYDQIISFIRVVRVRH